jgi:hypothetical protein
MDDEQLEPCRKCGHLLTLDDAYEELYLGTARVLLPFARRAACRDRLYQLVEAWLDAGALS